MSPYEKTYDTEETLESWKVWDDENRNSLRSYLMRSPAKDRYVSVSLNYPDAGNNTSTITVKIINSATNVVLGSQEIVLPTPISGNFTLDAATEIHFDSKFVVAVRIKDVLGQIIATYRFNLATGGILRKP